MRKIIPLLALTGGLLTGCETTTHPPCPEESPTLAIGESCQWDAKTQGNGYGESYTLETFTRNGLLCTRTTYTERTETTCI